MRPASVVIVGARVMGASVVGAGPRLRQSFPDQRLLRPRRDARPALGQLLAEIMSDGVASSLDVGALRPSRFLEGKPNPVSSLL